MKKKKKRWKKNIPTGINQFCFEVMQMILAAENIM
jgi:hypothetical protein